MNELDLTILIPAINEGPNLAVLLPQLNKCFGTTDAAYEILILDDGSNDNSQDVVRANGARIEQQRERGYASAIWQGIRSSKGKRIIMMDADGSHTAESALALYTNRNLADIVINSRYIAGGGSTSDWHRKALSYFLNLLFRSVLRLPFKEISGGFRIYRREVFDTFTSTAVAYELMEELLIMPYWLGFTAKEIPYIYRERLSGHSKAKIFKYGIRLLLAVNRFRKIKKSVLQAGRVRMCAGAEVKQ